MYMTNRLKPLKIDIEHFLPLSETVRKAYEELDKILIGIDESESFILDPEAKRTLELARTHLETSSFYAIRTVALKHREEENEPA